ncbi:hypothetical protein Bhyg_02150 [Pseudolycoriella hygida]|uniref:Uncharacterized protein n=1 Tax=Pseudolycoriella hygida TaxID=35572 RepID=A0A9Q0NCF4_9DIPT|nr:hypothetical protein Bhyg_02150 [Pseudolycoriella hygida]
MKSVHLQSNLAPCMNESCYLAADQNGLRTMNSVISITGFFKVILIFFLLSDWCVLGERLLWQNEAEINAEPTLRHYKHHKNKQKHNEDITEVYTFNLNHDYNHEKNNVRRYINQSSYPISTPSNPWRKLVSRQYSKPSQNAKNFYNVSQLMQNRLFDRDVAYYSTRPPKIRHPYDVLKVPYKERVRIKPI